MVNDALTLYKLMVLYMLDKANLPLNSNQILEFMLDKEYTSYFTMQSVFNELIDDEFVTTTTLRNVTKYHLTQKGRDTIQYFPDTLSPAIRSDIDRYLYANSHEFKQEASSSAYYQELSANSYMTYLSVTEGDEKIIDLSIHVTSEEEADYVCSKWAECNQEIYSFVVDKLLS